MLSLGGRPTTNGVLHVGGGEGRAVVPRILARHVIPNVLPSAIVMVSLLASTVILLEAGLGFIGLSDPAAMSWGYLTNNAQRFLRVAWWMSVFPGAAIAVAVLGINLLGDAVNDVLNPRSVTRLRK